MLLRLDEYSLYLNLNNAAKNTQLSYRRDLFKFETWIADKFKAGDIYDISGIMLEEYMSFLDNSGYSASTISRTATALRKYFSWAFVNGYIFNDPSVYLEAPKVIRKKPVAVEAIDILKLIKAIDTKNAKGMRDIAIMRLIMSTGISSAEILSLQTKDIDFERKVIYAGSEKKRRLLKPDRKAFLALMKYIDKARPQITEKALKKSSDTRKKTNYGSIRKDEDFLFLNSNGRKLTRQGLWKSFKCYAAGAGISSKVTPENLRHSFAINALKSGDDTETIRIKLGHITSSAALEYEAMLKSES